MKALNFINKIVVYAAVRSKTVGTQSVVIFSFFRETYIYIKNIFTNLTSECVNLVSGFHQLGVEVSNGSENSLPEMKGVSQQHVVCFEICKIFSQKCRKPL